MSDIHTITLIVDEYESYFIDPDTEEMLITITFDVEHNDTLPWVPLPYDIDTTRLFDGWLHEDTYTVFDISDVEVLEITEDMVFIAQYRFVGIERTPMGVSYTDTLEDEVVDLIQN